MNVINKIINDKITCYFISPHLDDAILSAGGLIDYLANKTRVEIITIFTQATPRPYTRFCKKFMSDCGYTDADLFFQDRRKEDEIVCKKVKVDYQHLEFIDVAWRKKQSPNLIEKLSGIIHPEVLHLYPLGRNFMSGKTVEEDKEMISEITKKLQSFMFYASRFKKSIIFSPLAIGNHVDHVIVRNICSEIFPLEKLIFWTDYPYSEWGQTPEDFISKLKLKSFSWGKNSEKKRDLILGYKTQIPALFPRGLSKVPPEVFYSKA
ncbi:hypothetical protein A3I50_01755 [Candidatus Roizmanbacteria bacterium RIFCSPLOWO2_02_FULL_37_9]|nr:MAG: hypothetical protein A3F57_06420 [Candidatus Roizmanbacteria bacterium RIFCSPHIGHO2_12_FULL_36_11]OGK56682.1 MAG: hypothetical protein A3I50_01755 [Candidatus Roizmanbacteria bacterium RIFCSPLOWO2_02_FULL_37_9]